MDSAHALALSLALLFGDGAGLPSGQLALPGKQAITYLAREGDLVFYDDRNSTWTLLFALAGTGPPLHMGIVAKTKAGQLAVLEAGPDDTVRVAFPEMRSRLNQFQRDFPKGTITIRRCKIPLTAEQSSALTAFAHAQEGKRYAVLRLLQQGTKYRVRGPLEPWFAGTELDRISWICSELSVAGATVAGLVTPKQVPANVVYPLDLVNDRRYDLHAIWDEARLWRKGD